MKRVLITRPEPGATQTAARVRSLGFVPVIAPVLSITKRQAQSPNHVAATVLTSRNAILACSSSLHGCPVFAVGAATAACAAHAGFDQIFSAGGNATALATLIAETLSPAAGTLFLPSAKGQGGELAAALRHHGFRVLRRVAYEAAGVTTLPEAAATHLRRAQIAVAMFFSGETSRHFVRLLRAANLADTVGSIEAVSISEQAAMALRPLPWRRIRVAAKPNQDAMLALLQ